MPINLTMNLSRQKVMPLLRLVGLLAIYGVAYGGTVTYTDKGAFVAAVGSNPLGQENFSEYAPGNYTIIGPLSFDLGPITIAQSMPSGLPYGGLNLVPGGAGNYAISGGYPSIGGAGLTYLGFSYYTNVSSVTINADGTDYTEPGQGFFGIISTTPFVSGAHIGGVPTPQIDNVLWAGGPGITPNNPLFPDSSQCVTNGQGLECYYGVLVSLGLVFLDPGPGSTKHDGG